MADEWWHRFFGDHWARIREGMLSPERTLAECNLIESALELESGANLLDIPCGQGRHAIELARRGFRVTGVDFNADYIATARADAERARVEVRFLVADMRELASPERFDAAYCYFGSFGYFSEEDDVRFTRAVAAVLKPRGRFLVEGHVAETLLQAFRERDWFWAGPPENRVRVLEERRWDVETGRVHSTWTIVDRDDLRSEETSHRIYAYRELKELLLRAGFVSVEIRDGKSGTAFQTKSPRAIVVARMGSD
jgi:SAM-dependent methyltransferase